MHSNYVRLPERPQFIEFHDELNVKDNKKLQKLIPDVEKIYFSGTVVKINGRSKAQKRILIITNRGVYNIHPRNTVATKVAYWISPASALKRRIGASRIDSVTISTHPNSEQFVLHAKGEYDYLFDGIGKRDKILKALTQLYCPVFGDHFTFYLKEEADLRKYRTTEEDFKEGIKKKPQEGGLQISQGFLGRGPNISWVIQNHKQFLQTQSGYNSSNGAGSMHSLPETHASTITSAFSTIATPSTPSNQMVYISQIPPQIPYMPYQNTFDRTKLIQAMDDIPLTSSVTVQIQPTQKLESDCQSDPFSQ